MGSWVSIRHPYAWIPGYQDTRIPGYQNTRIPGYRVTRIPGYQDTIIPRYQDTRIPGYQDTRLPGYRDIRLAGYQNTRIPGYQATTMPGYLPGYQDTRISRYQYGQCILCTVYIDGSFQPFPFTQYPIQIKKTLGLIFMFFLHPTTRLFILFVVQVKLVITQF